MYIYHKISVCNRAGILCCELIWSLFSSQKYDWQRKENRYRIVSFEKLDDFKYFQLLNLDYLFSLATQSFFFDSTNLCSKCLSWIFFTSITTAAASYGLPMEDFEALLT